MCIQRVYAAYTLKYHPLLVVLRWYIMKIWYIVRPHKLEHVKHCVCSVLHSKREQLRHDLFADIWIACGKTINVVQSLKPQISLLKLITFTQHYKIVINLCNVCKLELTISWPWLYSALSDGYIIYILLRLLACISIKVRKWNVPLCLFELRQIITLSSSVLGNSALSIVVCRNKK